MTNQSIYSQLVEYPHQYYKIEAFLGMGQNVPSHPGPIPASHRTGMGPNFFSWDGMGPNLCGMGAPGPVPALCQDRDGTRSWWDGSSHPGPTASLSETVIEAKLNKKKSSTIECEICMISKTHQIIS